MCPAKSAELIEVPFDLGWAQHHVLDGVVAVLRVVRPLLLLAYASRATIGQPSNGFIVSRV